MTKFRSPQTGGSTSPTATSGGTDSRQVVYLPVFELVAPHLGDPCLIPGTPRWCLRQDDDPEKWQALLWPVVWWAVGEDARQAALAEASREISQAADWTAISRTRSGVYIPREVA